ncbi:MAG: hypothetical protein RSC20_07160, partial [Clostridiales bacterium]
VSGYVPAYNGLTVSGVYVTLTTAVTNADNVQLVVDLAATATIGDVLQLEKEISDIQAYVGYTSDSIYGVEVDFSNKKFTRLAGAAGKTPGTPFDGVNAFGGRRRCNLTDSGVVVAYHGDAAYSETGKLLQAVHKNGIDYPIGTNIQTMVEQPKFYYKVVPLELAPANEREVVSLSVTTGCTTAGTVLIGIDGHDYGLNLTVGDNTPEAVAAKIRALVISGFTVGGSGKIITFTAKAEGVKIAPVFNGAATGVTATFTVVNAGYIGQGFKAKKVRYYVSDTMREGFKLHPAFVVGAAEKKFIYLSAFEGSLYDASATAYILDDAQIADFAADMLCSISNVKPISGTTQNLTRANLRALAQKR